MLGVVALGERKHQEARAFFEESRSLREEPSGTSSAQSLPYNIGLLALDQGQYDEARTQLEAGLAPARKYGQEEQVAENLCDLGFAAPAAAPRRGPRAARGIAAHERRASLEGERRLLPGRASRASPQPPREFERAARLLGAAEALGEDIHLGLEPYVESTRAMTAHELDSRLGNDRFAVRLAEGRSLSLSEAVSLALADGD